MITEMMHLDNGFDDLSNRERKKQRQLVLQDKVDAYFEWVKLKYSQVTHNSVIGRALAYSINTYDYFELLLSEIPKHQDDKDLKLLDDLLPWSRKVQKKCPSRFKKS